MPGQVLGAWESEEFLQNIRDLTLLVAIGRPYHEIIVAMVMDGLIKLANYPYTAAH